ncbi:MAG: hypothetical protein LBI33_12885 [Propionibacteriaceae bacterium]|jgi:hypothetical protein|nr:hypothetical protein [Propionibacteriaceae bacterium]
MTTTEVTPVFEPGRTITFTFEAAATAGASLKLGAADYSVVPATTVTDLVIGQAEHDVSEGRRAAVGMTTGHGVRRYQTTTPIPVGTFVGPAGGGTVTPVTTGPAIGVVVKASTTTDPTVHVLVGVPFTEGV